MKKNTVILSVLITLASYTQAQEPNERLIKDFYQGNVEVNNTLNACIKDNEWGNCVAIAVIKAALGKFKTINNIYKEYDTKNNMVYITFNDGVQISLSKEELDIVNTLAKFEKSENSVYYNDAIIIYASMCKRALVRKNVYNQTGHCIANFTDAVSFINSGYSTPSCGELLGLKLVSIRKSKIKTTEAVIINTSAHTAFCSYGTQDNVGRTYVIKLNHMKNPRGPERIINHAYVLSK
jgi:hypothetical protein